MLIEAVYKHVGQAISISEKARKDPSTAKVISTTLGECIKSYNKVIHYLRKALAASSAKQTATLKDLLGSAIKNVDHCDRSFLDQNVDSPMVEMDHTLVEMLGYGLDISNKLLK